jgi:hypothetical protein
MIPTNASPLRDTTREVGSGTDVEGIPWTVTPAVVPKENVADVTVVAGVIPGPMIKNVADSDRKGL